MEQPDITEAAVASSLPQVLLFVILAALLVAAGPHST